MPFWKDRSLAIVHAAGSPDATRSHFDAQDFMESGTPGVKSTKDGFLARAIGKPKSSRAPRAVAITTTLPRIFAGAPDAIAATDLAKFRNERASRAVRVGVSGSVRSRARARQGRRERRSAEADRESDQERRRRGGGVHGRRRLGHARRRQKAPLANNLRRLSEDIAAFAKDLGSRMSDVVLVTMSEFGRTVRENGNRGTDHGHGGVMIVLGGNVRGGKVHGKWPGLEREQLFEGRDLAVTTDFRDVFGEVLTKHLGVTSLATVFPGYAVKRVGRHLGVRWRGGRWWKPPLW